MSDAAFRTQNPYPGGWRTNWAAIWAGVFTFAAIWTIFETLALAIFPGTANTGFGIWTVILTIIAMYVAGLETGRLAGVSSRHEGLVHGIIMFGLSMVGAIIVTSVATQAMVGANASHTVSITGLTVGTEWATFLAVFLGWLAAMGGASTGAARLILQTRTAVEPPVQMRPAA